MFSGRVSDAKQEALPGAQIVLLKADSIYAATLADELGQFAIRNVPTGVYGLQIVALGYTPIEEKERKIADDASFDFILEKESDDADQPFIEAKNSMLSTVCSIRCFTNSIASNEFISDKYLRKIHMRFNVFSSCNKSSRRVLEAVISTAG